MSGVSANLDGLAYAIPVLSCTRVGIGSLPHLGRACAEIPAKTLDPE